MEGVQERKRGKIKALDNPEQPVRLGYFSLGENLLRRIKFLITAAASGTENSGYNLTEHSCFMLLSTISSCSIKSVSNGFVAHCGVMGVPPGGSSKVQNWVRGWIPADQGQQS